MVVSSTKPKWDLVKLGQLFKIKHGFAFKGEYFVSKGKFLLLTPGNFKTDGGIKIEDEQKYYDGQFPEEFLLKKGDLLVVMTDLIQDAPILGSPAFIPEDGKYLHNQRLGKIVDVKTDLVDITFLYYLFNRYEIRAQIKGSATGTTVKHTAPERIYAVKTCLPPLPVQSKIASILSAYDDLIENNTRRIKILEEMAQRIYREWFVDFRFPGHKKAEMVDSELGKIPEGWEAKPIGEVVDILGGGTPSTKIPEYWENGDINWYTPSDLTANKAMFISDSSNKITRVGLKHSSAKLFPSYCVMMTSRATIGVTSINTQEACTNQGFIICIPNKKASIYQIYFWIDQNKELIDAIASGATYKEIGRSEFRSLLIPVATSDVNSRFIEIVEPIEKQIEVLLRKKSNLRQTRDLLLPKFISGEFDVTNVDIDTNRSA